MGNVSGVKAKTFGQGATTSNVNVAVAATPATAFTLIGQLPVTPANNNVAVLNITSAGNVSTVNFTITGVNSLGVAATSQVSEGSVLERTMVLFGIPELYRERIWSSLITWSKTNTSSIFP